MKIWDKDFIARELPEFLFLDSDEIVSDQNNRLRRFIRPKTPRSLIADCNQAIEWTGKSDGFCKSALEISNFCANVESAGVEERFKISKFVLLGMKDKIREKMDIDDEQFDAVWSRKVEVLDGLISLVLRSGIEDKTYKQIVEEYVSDKDDVEKLSAPMEMTQLLAQKNQVDAYYDLMPSIILLLLIWRGIFYYCVVGRSGSALERQLVKDKTLSALKGILPKIIALIPIVGNIFDVIETIFKLYEARMRANRHIDELVENIESTQDYVDKYVEALTLWFEAYSAVYQSAGDFLVEIIKMDEALQ